MSKLETIQHLPSSGQLQSLTQELQQLPKAIVEQLTPLLPAIEQTLQAQRETVELLTRQALQHIAQTQAQALQSIQAQQQLSHKQINESLTRLSEQIDALQTLPKRLQVAAAQRAQGAQQESKRSREVQPLTLLQGLALMLMGSVLTAALLLGGMRVFDVPAPQDVQQQAHR